ncbi:TIGR03808 family TAT-translocated repetitive protein [Devosia sp. 1566]|uniref:TIGR03808 family TAT-translocated repetitive protein n=1 Tax=Devosia sp. 1566 TaxID=2499144 RepID=UPI000FDBA991|nr:TIGR03808 family TAT-translocated repetitive protein [Devosia sp. 1566]
MIQRRSILALGVMASAAALASPLRAEPAVDASAFGLDGTSSANQSGALQAAIDAATGLGQPLALPSGTYTVTDIRITAPLRLQGSGQTILALAAGGDSILSIENTADVILDGLTFAGNGNGTGRSDTGLVQLVDATDTTLRDCRFTDAPAQGLLLARSAASITGCSFSRSADAAIYSIDSLGLLISGNRITGCGNGGILIWRSEPGWDRSIITNNAVSSIDWRDGGNGQNGNGINIFRADGVIVSDNQISDCAFSAIRLNTANDTQITGNTCTNGGEIAIYSEFAFAGSIIANNLVDGAAGGISMTNWDNGGRLAMCSGNIVRNITATSRTNPDVNPYGIAAEADAVISGNIIDTVPGIGIGVGWGPFLRDVLVSDNLIRGTERGIVVSVAEGAGAARITGNLISETLHPLVGARWSEIASTRLQDDAEQFPTLTVSGNTLR